MAKAAIVFAILILTAMPSPMFAQDKLSALQQEKLELLDENRQLRKENEQLKEKIAELEKRQENNSPNTKKEPKEKVDLTPHLSEWGGTFETAQGGKVGPKQTANGTVIAREEDTLTFSMELENGTVWEYDLKYGSKSTFSVTGTRRIKAANGVNANAAPPVGNVTGTGKLSADAKTITISTQWPGNSMSSQYVLKRKK